MNLDRHFSEEKIQMAYENVVRGPTHSITTEVHSRESPVRVLQRGPRVDVGRVGTMAKVHWRQKLEDPG